MNIAQLDKKKKHVYSQLKGQRFKSIDELKRKLNNVFE